MDKKRLLVCVVPAVCLLGGCVKTVDLDEGGSAVLKADERVVVAKQNTGGVRAVTFPRNGGSYQEEVGSNVQRYVCAEPSPDAVTANAISAALSGSSGPVTAGASGGYAESAASIGLRTGAITILRDLEYRACEALANGVVGAPAYSRIIAGIGPTTLGLVAIEGLTRQPPASSATITANAPATFSNTTFSLERATDQAGKVVRSAGASSGVNSPSATPDTTGAGNDKASKTTTKTAAADNKPVEGGTGTTPVGDPAKDTKLSAKTASNTKTADATQTAEGSPASGAVSKDVASAVVRIVCIAGVATPSSVRGDTAKEAIAACKDL